MPKLQQPVIKLQTCKLLLSDFLRGRYQLHVNLHEIKTQDTFSLTITFQ